METKFNFKSAICTSRSQSEKLLALGLKKETADCHWKDEAYFDDYEDWNVYVGSPKHSKHIPAWSLHRLLSLLPKYIRVRKESFGRFRWTTLELTIDAEFVVWYREDIDNSEVDENFYAEDIYTSLCDCIEWLIKEGYFNKEYLK